MTRVVVLKTLCEVDHYKRCFPGALVVSAFVVDNLRRWVSDEIYVDERAASPDVMYTLRGRQKTFANPTLAVLPLWKIRAKFMSAHEALALYAREGRP